MPVDLTRLAAIAERTPTPFFVYDPAAVSARATSLRASLPAGSRLLYSVKANPHPEVLRAATVAGCGVELASPGELARAMECGLDPAEMLLVGPAKSDDLLAEAVERKVGLIAVESVEEVRRLDEAAGRAGRTQVLVRLNLAGARGSLRMGSHQFGMDAADVPSCLRRIEESASLRLAGYHGFVASQLLNYEDLAHNARLIAAAVLELAGETGAAAWTVDLGGGFGIPYRSEETPLDLARLRVALEEVAAMLPGHQLIFEAGRFISGPGGVLVTRVVEVKRAAGRRFVLLDGGTNASGIFGGSNSVRTLSHTVIRDGHPLQGGEPADLCGPLCTPMDRLATNVSCPARPGDLVIWWNMGAYGPTAAPTDFLSFPAPEEILLRDQAISLPGFERPHPGSPRR